MGDIFVLQFSLGSFFKILTFWDHFSLVSFNFFHHIMTELEG